MTQQGYNASQSDLVHGNDGKKKWTTLRSRTDLYTDTSGLPSMAGSELIENVNASIATKKDFTIAANTTNISNRLIEILDDQQKALIEALPRHKVEISSCTHAMKQAKRSKGQNAFQGIASKLNGVYVWMRMGDFNDNGVTKPVWAFLFNRETAQSLPSILLITKADSTSFKNLIIDEAKPYLTLRPEFAFADGRPLSALIKHYMFKGGVVVSYDITIQRPRYQLDLLNAARRYESQTGLRNINQRPRNSHHHPAAHIPSFTTSDSTTGVVEADATANPVELTREAECGHSVLASTDNVIKEFQMTCKKVKNERMELRIQKIRNWKDSKHAKKGIEDCRLRIDDMEKRLEEEREILRRNETEFEKHRTVRKTLVQKEAELKDQTDSALASLPSELRSFLALAGEAFPQTREPDGGDDESDDEDDDEDAVPLPKRRRMC